MYIEGCRCLDCGYAMMPKSSVDYFISPSIVEKELINALMQNDLRKSIEKIMALDLPIIKIEREKLINMLSDSSINYEEEPARISDYLSSWIMRHCKKCGSNNTAVYRWIKKSNVFVPAKGNLRLSNKARKILK